MVLDIVTMLRTIRSLGTSYTLSTAQTGFTARPWIHALRVKAYDWGQQRTIRSLGPGMGSGGLSSLVIGTG